jgi:hypothetical protein
MSHDVMWQAMHIKLQQAHVVIVVDLCWLAAVWLAEAIESYSDLSEDQFEYSWRSWRLVLCFLYARCNVGHIFASHGGQSWR